MNLGDEKGHSEHQPCMQGSPLYPPELGLAQDWPLSYSINQTDQMLAHLQSFSSVPEHFTLPDSTKSGVPLFYIPPGSTTPVSGSDLISPILCPPRLELAQHFPSLSSLRHPNQNLIALRAIFLPPSKPPGEEKDV